MLFAFREEYETELGWFAEQLGPGSVVVDVGANHGIYTLLAANRVGKDGMVLAIEPTPETMRYLSESVRLSEASNVRLVEAALGDHEGEVELFVGPNSGWNSFAAAEPNAVPVKVALRRLDAIVSEAGAHRVDLIKIDAEGAEELVLRGAVRVLTQFRPKVMFEFNPLATSRMGMRAQGPWEVLAGCGYSFFEVNEKSQRLESVPQCPSQGDYRNLVAIAQ